MSPAPTPASATGAFDFKAMLQELKANRRTQLALGAFAAVLVYAAYTLFAPSTPRTRHSTTVGAAAGLDSRQLQGLRRLPDLAALNRAGEVPSNPKVRRDLFLFEAPPAPVALVKKEKPAPPPPPPTPEELERQRLAQEKAAEYAARPQDLRYLGFFKGSPSGMVGAFMRGEEPVTLIQGTVLKERWKLVTILDTRAEFQNTKYPDLRLVLETREASGGAPTNQF